LRPRAADAEGDVVMGRRLYFSGKPGMAACVTCHGTAKPAKMVSMICSLVFSSASAS